MTTATVAEASPARVSGPDPRPYRLTATELCQMIEAGVFLEDSRVLLHDGRLYEKMAKTNAHGYVGGGVTKAVVRRLPDNWLLLPESTIVLDEVNAPLPDFVVVRNAGPSDCARPRPYPGSSEIGLVIEVAVTSLQHDFTIKLEKYAHAMIPAYWVVDVLGCEILACGRPRVVDGRGSYGHVQAVIAGQEVPLTLDGQEVARIPTDEIFGRV